jgi:hypothetical protein
MTGTNLHHHVPPRSPAVVTSDLLSTVEPHHEHSPVDDSTRVFHAFQLAVARHGEHSVVSDPRQHFWEITITPDGASDKAASGTTASGRLSEAESTSGGASSIAALSTAPRCAFA